ncbi:MAG: glucosyl-3-phosphoglycerate synthase [Planctomycetota bacterium]
MDIREWIRNNTFHHSQFWDIKAIVREKERQNLSISLCIPTLNEEKTIGKEVVIFKSELMQRYPLLDEIAVIDSGSEDQTREVASGYGAEVYLAREILPEMGDRRGKGENLWKAIYQLKGDILVYIDADIKNIHPRFVYGLVAPLVYHPQLLYVKAFYDRPLVFSHGVRPSGGGRVTEILIRPLFSLFIPELCAFIQPLSGEYAVRRSVLESIPFPIGYGVETSHLLDVHHRWGIEAFAQTDLDQRVHRNQPTRDLAKMSFGILQTFLFRLHSQGRLKDLPSMSDLLRQFQAHDKSYEMLEYKIRVEERPPMIEVPAYRQKRGLPS